MSSVPYEAVNKRGVGFKADITLGMLLISPIVITMAALVFYPMARTFWDSFHRVNPMQAGTPFVGLENYTRMLSDGQLGTTWTNTLIYVVLAVLAETIFGVFGASLINQLKVGRRWILAAVILPWALPGVVNSVIWLWIYQPGAGLLNGILTALGLPFENHVWFNDRTSAMSQYGLILLLGNLAIGVPSIILAAITLLGVPLVTRWALRSFNDLTGRLNEIDFGARGGVVDVRGLPREMRRVVDGINKALRRLDSGFETTERFFVNAAHELRTPIAILQVRVDTLPSGKEKAHLQSGIKRLTAITNQLLDIEKYRQKPASKTQVELNSLVSKVVADIAPFAFTEGYEISFDTHSEQAFVTGEPDALERAFTNLVRNAIQYGGKSGEISVIVETDGSVQISDQGIGIAADKHARIFEPFYRVNPHGSGAGLGLSMVHDIVTSHGGFIQLESSPGAGSTFIVQWREGRVVGADGCALKA